MSKNWGKTPVTNADNRIGQTQVTYLAPNAEGLGHEERIDRRPLGKAERFVDPQGNVCNEQMYTSGDPHRAQTEISKRSMLHRKGFVEYAKCPLKHGTRHSSPQATKDFAQMPTSCVLDKGKPTETVLEIPTGECRHDPKVMSRKDGDLYAETACPHIEWLIHYRREQQADAVIKRSAHTVEALRREREERELRAAQLEMVKEQLAERKSRKPSKAKDVGE